MDIPKVLLLEDEPADAHLVRIAFEEGKVMVDMDHVQDGVEGFAYLRREAPYQNAQRPDLILLDLNMPRMDGLQFLQKIKADEALKSIPVLMLTTSNAENDIVASYNSCAAGYIVKPMNIESFITTVRGISDYWITLVHLPKKP
ncbi:MAG: response regulator [Gammaproteobacteria bacterium]|nr:response regulator [Gammaproteobacteria bacterium]